MNVSMSKPEESPLSSKAKNSKWLSSSRIDTKPESWVMVGRVGRPLGVRGSFFVSGRTDPLPVDLASKPIRLGPHPDQGYGYIVESVTPKPQGGYVVLKDLYQRTLVEALRCQEIWLRKEDLIACDDEYFWSDLIGKNIMTNQGDFFGEIQRLNNYGASDIITVKGPQGFLDLPLVREYLDFSFSAKSPHLQLVVDSDLFDDCWYS